MKKDAGRRRVWLSSKWNIEMKEAFLNAHVQAEGPGIGVTEDQS